MGGSFVIGIQARIGSSRLPAKCFLPFGKMPLLLHIFSEAKRYFDDVYLLVPNSEQDLFSSVLGIPSECIIGGSEENVLERFASLGQKFPDRYIVRATGDNPNLSWKSLNALLTESNISEVDTLYSSRSLKNTSLDSSEWKGQNFDVFHS